MDGCGLVEEVASKITLYQELNLGALNQRAFGMLLCCYVGLEITRPLLARNCAMKAVAVAPGRRVPIREYGRVESIWRPQHCRMPFPKPYGLVELRDRTVCDPQMVGW